MVTVMLVAYALCYAILVNYTCIKLGLAVTDGVNRMVCCLCFVYFYTWTLPILRQSLARLIPEGRYICKEIFTPCIQDTRWTRVIYSPQSPLRMGHARYAAPYIE